MCVALDHVDDVVGLQHAWDHRRLEGAHDRWIPGGVAYVVAALWLMAGALRETPETAPKAESWAATVERGA